MFGGDGVAKLKSIKNDTMISNLATAMEKDGVALTRFFMMVEKEYPGGKLTEMELGKRLRASAWLTQAVSTRASLRFSDGTPTVP